MGVKAFRSVPKQGRIRGCQAAQSLPDYEPFPGDLNGDCIVDDLDLAILQEDWLKDNSLTE